MKWSDVRDVLVGLREYMVVQGHLFELVFLVRQEGSADILGSGQVQGEGPTSLSATGVGGGRGTESLF